MSSDTPPSALLRVLVVTLFGWLSFGCGGSDEPAKVPEEPQLAPLELRIVAAPNTNSGGALQVLVRKTTSADYPRDEYEKIAASLTLETDPGTVEWRTVLPGQTLEFPVERSEDGALAVYFLFAKPGPRWKYLFSQSATKVEFLLGLDRIEDTNVIAEEERDDARTPPQ